MIRFYLVELGAFIRALKRYGQNKLLNEGRRFETFKAGLVSLLLYKRGRLARPFVHTSVTGLLTLALLAAPLIPNSYPGIDDGAEVNADWPIFENWQVLGATVSTEISEKPRATIITHKVEPGETLTSIAKGYFGEACLDTLRWANNLPDIDSLKPGLELKIPPVCGVVHKVEPGETIYKLAKKYYPDAGEDLAASAQPIVDFPFNDFLDDETFTLLAGQTLIIPNGVMPKQVIWAPSTIQSRREVGLDRLASAGGFIWPVNGSLTQRMWAYHSGIDIANKSAPGIGAAKTGRVAHIQPSTVNGYGRYVILDHGNGVTTLYAHLSEIYVSAGETVSAGEVIGRMGSTGRSTGTHLHFEIRQNGQALNPLSYLQ